MNKDWDMVIMLIELTTDIEIPNEVKEVISKVPIPKGTRVNINTVRKTTKTIDQLVRHIKKVIDEGSSSQDFNHHLTEIGTFMKNIYKNLNKK